MEDIRVLIVDDSALMRNLIGKIVEATPGLKIADKAMNGRFALQKLDRVNPDIIVLDLEMPEMNGIEFLRELKKQNIKIYEFIKLFAKTLIKTNETIII